MAKLGKSYWILSQNLQKASLIECSSSSKFMRQNHDIPEFVPRAARG
jgi:hypothetical protein